VIVVVVVVIVIVIIVIVIIVCGARFHELKEVVVLVGGGGLWRLELEVDGLQDNQLVLAAIELVAAVKVVRVRARIVRRGDFAVLCEGAVVLEHAGRYLTACECQAGAYVAKAGQDDKQPLLYWIHRFFCFGLVVILS